MHERIPDGTKVIHRSNDWNDELLIGTLVTYDTFHGKASGAGIPKIVSDKDGREYLCFGCVRIHTPEIESYLNSLAPKEQWNAISNNLKY